MVTMFQLHIFTTDKIIFFLIWLSEEVQILCDLKLVCGLLPFEESWEENIKADLIINKFFIFCDKSLRLSFKLSYNNVQILFVLSIFAGV